MPPEPRVSITHHRRAKYAALSRHRTADDPAVIDAGRDLAAEVLSAQVAKVVSKFGPLTAEQRDRIAALLRGSEAPSRASDAA